MEYYKHEFSRKIKDIEKYLNKYFISDETIKILNLKLKKNEIHFINLLKLHFIYRVELTKEKKSFGSAIHYVIQDHRINFENDNIKDNSFYLVTNTEIKRKLNNKYNFKLIARDAVMQYGGYGDINTYQIIKITSKINKG